MSEVRFAREDTEPETPDDENDAERESWRNAGPMRGNHCTGSRPGRSHAGADQRTSGDDLRGHDEDAPPRRHRGISGRTLGRLCGHRRGPGKKYADIAPLDRTGNGW